MKLLNYKIHLTKADKAFILLWIFSVIIQVHYFNRVQIHLAPNQNGLVGFTTEDYEPLAKNLFFHGEYSTGQYPNLQLDNKRPPFYPFMLSMWYGLFGVEQFTALVFNNVFLSLSIIVVFLTGRIINPAVGLISAIIIICDPINIQRANSSQSEVALMFVFTISLFFLILYFVKRPRLIYALAFSVFFFLRTFTRATTLYFPYLLPFIFLLYIILLKDNFKKHLNFIIIFLLVNSIPTFLWMHRNYTATGVSVFSGEKNIHAYNYMAVVSTGAKEYHGGKVSRNELKEALDKKYLDNDIYRGLSEQDKYAYQIDVAKKVLINNWKGFTYHFIRQFPELFVGYNADVFWLNYSPSKYAKRQEFSKIKNQWRRLRALGRQGYWDYLLYSVIVIGILYINVILTAGGFYNLLFVNQDKRKIRFGIFIFILFCYIVAITCTWANTRQRMEISPIMALTSSYYLYILINRFKISLSLKKFVILKNIPKKD